MHLFGTHYKATAWMFLGVCVFAVADNLTGLTLLADVAAVLLAVFVVIEFRAAPRAHKYIGVILIAAGLAAGAWVGAFEQTVFTGFRRSMQFLVLWGAVLWLRMPPERSPSFQVMRDFVGGQPQGRRYMILALAGNFVGGTLNLAGVSLMSGLLTASDDPTTRRRLTQALMRGFLAASCWSPFYVAVAVILVVIPGVEWIEVAPTGLLMALGLIGLSWTADRIRRGNPAAAAARAEAPRMGLLTWIRLSVIAACLFALVLGGTELLGVSVPIVLGVIAPPFALGLDLCPRDTRQLRAARPRHGAPGDGGLSLPARRIAGFSQRQHLRRRNRRRAAAGNRGPRRRGHGPAGRRANRVADAVHGTARRVRTASGVDGRGHRQRAIRPRCSACRRRRWRCCCWPCGATPSCCRRSRRRRCSWRASWASAPGRWHGDGTGFTVSPPRCCCPFCSLRFAMSPGK